MTAAYTLWLLAAVALIFFGAAFVFANNFTNKDNARVFGVVLAIAGAAVGVLAGKARQGDVRFQRAAVALSMVLGLLLIAVVILAPGWGYFLIVGIMLLVAAFLTYRANVDRWFPGAEK